MTDYGEYRSFAERIAEEARHHTHRYFRRAIDIEYKSDRSPVTKADRETEELLRARIAESFPEHVVAGEEYGVPADLGEWTWVLDPIDGTQAFVHGVPLYTVLIALLHRGDPVVGVIHNPALEETVSAAVGGGCTYNGVTCSVRPCRSLAEAEVSTTDFVSFAEELPRLHSRVVSEAGFGRTWADGHGYLLFATGRVDLVIDPHMSIWDIAPLYPVIEESGGRITDTSGRRTPLGKSAVAAHPDLHASLFQ